MSKLPVVVAIALLGTPLPALAQSAFGEEALVEDTDLSRVAGREDLNQFILSDQKTTVSQNTIGNNSTTGSVQIDGNAFQNLSGMSVITANSGSQVAITSQMFVTISLAAN